MFLGTQAVKFRQQDADCSYFSADLEVPGMGSGSVERGKTEQSQPQPQQVCPFRTQFQLLFLRNTAPQKVI